MGSLPEAIYWGRFAHKSIDLLEPIQSEGGRNKVTKESTNMVVLIGKNGEGKGLDSIEEQMSRMKEAMTVLEKLIEGDKRASVEREEKMASLREHLGTSYSNEISKKLSAYNSAHLDLKRINNNTIRKYATMCVKYITLQNEFIALATSITME